MDAKFNKTSYRNDKGNIFLLFLQDNFEANHNKDYSVVKTFRAGKLALFHWNKVVGV